MANDVKVFGIGLSKTGTTSLTEALRVLGYRSVHFPIFHLNPDGRKLEFDFSRLNKWDAVTDTPVPYFYRELDQQFPGSKFVLTIRDRNDWLESCEKNHVWPGEFIHDKLISRLPYINQFLKLHHALYGSVWFDRQRFSYFYEKHIDDVQSYFQDRPNDLLVYDISRETGWEPICSFLGKEIPRDNFPRKNIGSCKVFKKESRRFIWKSLAAAHCGHRVRQQYLPLDVAYSTFKP